MNPEEAESDDEGGPSRRRWPLVRVAWLLFPFIGAWFLLALLVPSPVGVFVQAVPILGLALAVAALLWSWALLRSPRRWGRTLRTTMLVGLSSGMVLASVLAAAGAAEGCPLLSPFSSGEPGGWGKFSAPDWRDGARPVLFFVGSVACPFCSASSWAIWKALQAFGTVNGTYYGTSTPNDVDPNTPEVVLAYATLRSTWVSFDVREATNPTTIASPALASCRELGYVAAYSGGVIPFLVVDGTYIHTGTLVDPAQLVGLTPAQVASQVENASGPIWTGAIAPATYLLEAVLVKSTGGVPVSVASDPPVAADLAQIH